MTLLVIPNPQRSGPDSGRAAAGHAAGQSWRVVPRDAVSQARAGRGIAIPPRGAREFTVTTPCFSRGNHVFRGYFMSSRIYGF